MKETYGVPVEEIQEGIRHGVRKVDIDTDIRLAMTAAIRKFLTTPPSRFDPREYLKPAMLAAKAICKEAASGSAAREWRISSRCRRSRTSTNRANCGRS
jgi:fructose/tagatose bisphosphate aldolase